MTTFYYWLPTERPATSTSQVLSDLHAAGLSYATENRVTCRGSDKGPDGKRGVVVCHGGNPDGKLGWWPDSQTWKRVPSTDVWCGMFTDDRPTPDDLARGEQVTGEWLTFDDGRNWLAPKARRWREFGDHLLWEYNLPRCLELADDGTWQPGGVKPKYERLWRLATAYEQAVAEAFSEASEDDDHVRFTFDEIDSLAIGALQVNYRVNATELSMLGVYDLETRQRLIDVLLDNATWQRWVKKKLADQTGGSS